jgi:hypothetical protein
MAQYYRGSGATETRLRSLLERLYQEFGWGTRLFAASAGRYIYFKLKQEEKRLAGGWSYEPGSFYEKNDAALALEKHFPADPRTASTCARWVTAKLSPFPG